MSMQRSSWLSITLTDNGHEVVAYECSKCHKFTYKGTYVNAPMDRCPNCKSQMNLGENVR